MKLLNIELTFECPECENRLIYDYEENYVYKRVKDLEAGPNDCCEEFAKIAKNESKKIINYIGSDN